MRKVIVSVLGLLILSGCATMNKTMASWEGSHVRDLLISWGRPSEVYSDGEGSRLPIHGDLYDPCAVNDADNR